MNMRRLRFRWLLPIVPVATFALLAIETHHQAVRVWGGASRVDPDFRVEYFACAPLEKWRDPQPELTKAWELAGEGYETGCNPKLHQRVVVALNYVGTI